MLYFISRGAIRRIRGHGLNVLPLEAYGFLLGSQDTKYIYAALPVGKTPHWHSGEGRFALLAEHFESAQRFARERALAITGVYHTDAGDVKTSLLEVVPAAWQSCLVLIFPLIAWEDIWWKALYRYGGHGGWMEVDKFLVDLRNPEARLNPRRIHTAWLKCIGPIDYGNNHETEYPRLYGPKDRLQEWQEAEKTPVNPEGLISDMVKTIHDHIQRKKALIIRYEKGISPDEPRTIIPLGMFTVAGYPGVYVSAFDAGKQAERCFLLDNMDIIQATGQQDETSPEKA